MSACSGNGTLNICNGGAVSVSRTTYVASNSGSTGAINFGPGGGTLTTQGLVAGATQLTGTGTINTHGLVSDIGLVFDSGPRMTTILNQSGQNITINLDTSNSSNVGDLGVGYCGSGSLTVRNGVTVNSANGYLGYQPGSGGIATVDGSGSKWLSSGDLYVGNSGSGTLSVTNGGAVGSDIGYVGGSSGSRGMMMVTGAGSKWSSTESVYIGNSGYGTLSVTNGAAPSALRVLEFTLVTTPARRAW